MGRQSKHSTKSDEDDDGSNNRKALYRFSSFGSNKDEDDHQAGVYEIKALLMEKSIQSPRAAGKCET